MRKLWIALLAVLFVVFGMRTGNAYIPYTDFFPSIGPTHYLGTIDFSEGEGELVDIYIANDDTIDTMIQYRFYTENDRKWRAKILFVPKSEKIREVCIDIVNEGANNDTWFMNNRLSLPVNNKLWALRRDVSYFPNEQAIEIWGLRAYNPYGEMLGFDKNKSQETSTVKYGEDKIYSAICDMVSVFMAERYQGAVVNSQSFVR